VQDDHHGGAARANRSQLVAPGSSDRFMAKAAVSDADVVLLDLEDAVALDDKDAARERVIAALGQLDFGGKTVSVRWPNAPDRGWT
jgi:malyl-CoA/(S)-citramalyl-CoA lyase